MLKLNNKNRSLRESMAILKDDLTRSEKYSDLAETIDRKCRLKGYSDSAQNGKTGSRSGFQIAGHHGHFIDSLEYRGV